MADNRTYLYPCMELCLYGQSRCNL
jgi:hypothetical protein